MFYLILKTNKFFAIKVLTKASRNVFEVLNKTLAQQSERQQHKTVQDIDTKIYLMKLRVTTKIKISSEKSSVRYVSICTYHSVRG